MGCTAGPAALLAPKTPQAVEACGCLPAAHGHDGTTRPAHAASGLQAGWSAGRPRLTAGLPAGQGQLELRIGRQAVFGAEPQGAT